jgi:hypothetical protein
MKTKNHTKTTLLLASAVTLLSLSGPAMATTTFTDNFDTAHNYSGGNVAGTIWNGVVNAGNAVTLNSSTATAGQLRIAANAVGWDAGVNNAPFLYKDVAGDFDARVQVTAMTTGNYNVGALMARLGNSSDDGTAGEDFMMVASNKFATIDIQGRSLNDATKLDSNGTSALDGFPRWLRLTRTSNTFNIYYGTDGTTWTGFDWGGVVGANIGLDLVRTDLNGKSLQVGLWQGSFASSGHTADFDNFSVTVIPEPSAGLLALGAGGLVLRRSRRMTR